MLKIKQIKLIQAKLQQCNKYCIPDNKNYNSLLKTKSNYLKALKALEKL